MFFIFISIFCISILILFYPFFGPKAGGRDLVSLLLLHKKKLLRIRKLQQERTTPRRKMQSICKQLLKNKYPRQTKCQAQLGEVLSIQKIIKIKNFREDPTLFKSRKETLPSCWRRRNHEFISQDSETIEIETDESKFKKMKLNDNNF